MPRRKVSKANWYWWEVQFDEIDVENTSVVGLEACVMPIDVDDVDLDDNDNPVESTHFIESSVFCVVHTVTVEPLDAIKRALLQLRPVIMEAREDVQWANIRC